MASARSGARTRSVLPMLDVIDESWAASVVAPSVGAPMNEQSAARSAWMRCCRRDVKSMLGEVSRLRLKRLCTSAGAAASAPVEMRTGSRTGQRPWLIWLKGNQSVLQQFAGLASRGRTRASAFGREHVRSPLYIYIYASCVPVCFEVGMRVLLLRCCAVRCGPLLSE